MDWKIIIEQLAESGMSEQAIAEALSRELPEPVRQPTINRLKTRKTKNPGYALGKALVDLHHARVVAGASRQNTNHTNSPQGSPQL